MEYCLSYCFRNAWVSGEFIIVAQLIHVAIPVLMLFSDYKSYWYYFITILVSSMSLITSKIMKIPRSHPECVNFLFSKYAFPATEQAFLASVLTMEILLVHRWNIKKIIMRLATLLLIPWIYYASMVSNLSIGYITVALSVFITYLLVLLYSKFRRNQKTKHQTTNTTTTITNTAAGSKKKSKVSRGICGCISVRSTGVYLDSDSDSDDIESSDPNHVITTTTTTTNSSSNTEQSETLKARGKGIGIVNNGVLEVMPPSQQQKPATESSLYEIDFEALENYDYMFPVNHEPERVTDTPNKPDPYSWYGPFYGK